MTLKLNHGPLQATLSKLLTYCTVCSVQLSLLPSAGREMSSSWGIGIRGEGLVWLFGATVCLLAAPWVQSSVCAGNGWPRNALQHHWLMPISCHFRDCKALLVTCLTRVSSAIASVQTFTFTFTSQFKQLICILCKFCRHWQILYIVDIVPSSQI